MPKLGNKKKKKQRSIQPDGRKPIAPHTSKSTSLKLFQNTKPDKGWVKVWALDEPIRVRHVVA